MAKPMTVIAASILALLTGCSEPGLYAGVGIGPNGVTVRPVATARVGGAHVSISP
ncbi:hypothetical protein [Pseudorhodobacter sp.]|uniref:hypothetical protein n=1 Tax=Pseudorhodobacter sp. TaxID=1934400 RepID=UPI002648FC0F|nr:hypothetical protein [Pseudorhodobacter sp.]MDN5787873.1 hypothetical protein [Pseudorhodobacter sp.]